MHKVILIKKYFNNNFYFIYYIYRARSTFRCYGKRLSLVRVRARSTFDAMINGQAWFASVLDPQYGSSTDANQADHLS